jgi:serine/threonine protein kinase/formylglycine-generating enzyme required for sulfatase activity
MTEEDILAEVLKIRDPAERATFLHQVCAGQAALHRRIEQKLQAQSQTKSLPKKPALDPSAATNPKPADTCSSPGGLAEPPDALAFLEPPRRMGSIGLLGHYDIRSVVGQGGMGVVLKAFDEKLHRVVAVKVMSAALAGNPDSRRFVREARAAAAVTYENIVALYAVEDEGPLPYLVMQFVSGRSLADRLARGGPLDVETIVRLGVQIASGLEAAHRIRLVHRDIKPANLLLEEGSERLKITDFGLARVSDDASITHSGGVLGTPLYMSPEQAEGKPLDHRSDLFSLGSVLYTMCTGRPPFGAKTTLAVLRRVCDDTPRPVRLINPDIPPWLEKVVNKLLAKEPAGRYQSAGQVAQLLQQHLTTLSPSPQSAATTVALPAARTLRRKRPLLLASALLALAVLGGGLALLVLGKDDPPDKAGRKDPGDDSRPRPEGGKGCRPPPKPKQALAPFDERQARAHQEAWADHLRVDVDLVNSIGMKLRLIPPGEFVMGSPDAVIDPLLPGAFNDNYRRLLRSQKPRHRVRLTRPIFIAVYEVTQRQFRRVMRTNPSAFARAGDQKAQVAGLDTRDFPVENMTWFAAIEFCNRLSKREGKCPCYQVEGPQVRWVRTANGYRLPTEAVWEFVCRAGTTTVFPWGDQAGDLKKAGRHGQTRTGRVGQGPANPFGLFDLFGNVSEYCFDPFDFDYYAVAEKVDPAGPKAGPFRVVRGTGIYHPDCDGGSAFRTFTLPTQGNRTIGFRVVCAAPAAPDKGKSSRRN